MLSRLPQGIVGRAHLSRNGFIVTFGVLQLTGDLSPEGGSMANKDEYEAAIKRVKESPQNASSRDWDLTKKAAQQAGSMGNQAREALNGNNQARSWF